MPFPRHPRPETLTSLVDARPFPYWFDDSLRPEPAGALIGSINTDLLVIGAGFTGLWTALLAKDNDNSRQVVLIEAEETAIGASGRNGGFVAASITHGLENGYKYWPDELPKLVSLGQSNLEAIQATVERFTIECDFLRVGEILVATETYQIDELRRQPEIAGRYGEKWLWLDQDELRSMINSPLFLGGVYNPYSVAMVNPAQLAWGLKRACLEIGVQVHEHTPALSMNEENGLILVKTPYGRVRAKKVALATNAFTPLITSLSRYIVPVYDYVLVTEPLSTAQRASIGWQDRQGLADANNQFHYFRMTKDGRILWGGYDAVYHRNNAVGKHLELDYEVFGRLAEHFFMTFPQLNGMRFTHSFGGAIDTCSRFTPFWGTTFSGHVAYVLGFTGLGVGSSRFGALVMLDLLDGKSTERTTLKMVQTKPIPFPPEPFRSMVIGLTRKSLEQADLNQGKRNLWLRLLDRVGLGFDS
jgi:glycine/D-amino acid oxidase-like deaminating enzyme